MTTTFIDTARRPRVKLAGGQGEVAEIINRDLCGAQNVVAKLHWLKSGERFDAESLVDTHQLFYLLEGECVINLENKNYRVGKGAGVYLGPSETVSISHAGAVPLKVFHLAVPIIKS